MCQGTFAEMSSQIYLKEKSNNYAAHCYSRIRPIERNLKTETRVLAQNMRLNEQNSEYT